MKQFILYFWLRIREIVSINCGWIGANDVGTMEITSRLDILMHILTNQKLSMTVFCAN